MHRVSGLFRLLALIALGLVCVTINFARLSQEMVVSPRDYFSFHAREPFIYRPLLPAALSLLPIDFARCSTGLNAPLDGCANVAALALDSAFLLVTALCICASIGRVAMRCGRGVAWGALAVPVVVWMVVFTLLVVPNRSLYYPYDMLDLMFVALGARLACEYNRRYQLLVIPLAFIAAFNKETAIFIPVTAMFYWRFVGELDRRRLAVAAVAAATTLAAKPLSIVLVAKVFGRSEQAKIFEWQLTYNLIQLVNPLLWLALGSSLGGGLIALALPAASPRVRELRRATLLLLGLWFTVIMMVGIVREVRLLAPIIPLMVLVLVALQWDQMAASKLSSADASLGRADSCDGTV